MPPPNRDPVHLARTTPVSRGQLIRLGVQEESAGGGENTILTFQYNPETVTRSRTGRWDPRKRRRAADAVQTPQQLRGELGGHGASALLAESETIAFKLVFDATEATLRGGDAGTEALRVGVLPELSFLELVSVGRDVEQQRAGRPQGTQIRPIRPDELLLQLGATRWYPCVLTDLSITEQRFSPTLVPVRAEVDLKLTVLEPVENSYNPLVRQAFDHLMLQRSQHTADLGTTSSATLQSQLGGGVTA